MMVQHGDAALFHLFGKHGLLLAAVELQKGARPAGKGVPLEVPAAERTHVDAPLLPHLHDAEAFLKMQAHEVHILGLAYEAAHEFSEHGFHVVAVHFGTVAAEMVVARRAGTGTLHMAFFQHDHTLCAAVRCGDGRHGSADTSAHDDHIGFNLSGNGDHYFTSVWLMVSALTCRSV